MENMGVVYLVGAGPGDPRLITVRGLECLRRADVVIYDRLVNEALLDEAPAWAERVLAGKTPGAHPCRQEQINALMIDRAGAGQAIVRLKGGDPFVFGRGGEQASACADAGVRWEVVPGVTSAVGVPACAGIPLNWAALAQIDTLVVLMGVEHLRTLPLCSPSTDEPLTRQWPPSNVEHNLAIAQ